MNTIYETAVIMCLLVMTDNDCGSYRHKAAEVSSVGLYTVTADSIYNTILCCVVTVAAIAEVGSFES